MGERKSIQSEWMGDVPYGCIYCSLEDCPRVHLANDRMFRLLHTTAESESWNAFIAQNLFFMVPFEDHSLFRSYLQQVRQQTEALAVEHRIRTAEGEIVPVIGWMQVMRRESGVEELRLLYMPAPERRGVAQSKRERAYLNVLKGTYDLIFEIDHTENTIECIFRKDESLFHYAPGVRIVMGEGIKKIVLESVFEEDQLALEQFAANVLDPKAPLGDGLLEQTFALIRDASLREYHLIASRLDERTTLLCGKDMMDAHYAALLEEEVDRLRIMQMSMAGMEQGEPTKALSFRMVQDRVFPTSGRNAICQYCGFTEDEYLYMKDEGLELGDFLEKCHIMYGKYITALQEGEVEFGEEGNDLVKMYISKHATLPGQKEEYTVLLLYPVYDAPVAKSTKRRVSIRTFGHFDVFVDGEPVNFHYEKSKEMLAVLVDRNGGYVSNPYLISCLWESEPYSEKIQGRCRQAAHRLTETLKRYGIEDIIEKTDGKRRLVPELVDCDYYNYIMGRRIPGQQFNGSYMADYSWGEETLSGLLKMNQ
ncbi:MAG: hypothetical protein IKC24_02115 [Oscillospiraceae bacterium]|nr:hypothetical protein [Oscillospiraceae bacterium]MBR6677331.1 hypothetical protein [Oscillospiraceae bacterium]